MRTWIAEKGSSLRAVIINAESINSLDSSAVHFLEEFVEELEQAQQSLLFSGVKGPVRDSLAKAGLLAKIGAKHFFMSVQEAVNYYDQQQNNTSEVKDFSSFTLQTNVWRFIA